MEEIANRGHYYVKKGHITILWYIRLTPVHTSMAFVYATGGKELLMEAVWVDIVSSVVTPKLTRAGTALGSNQKLTHETITSMQQGT